MGLKLSSIPNNYWTKTSKEGFGEGELIDIHDMHYNISWDWLMPVIFKIIDSTDAYAEYRHEVYLAIQKGIARAFNRVVEFIEWYNEQPK